MARVSIIVPSYNSFRTISQAVESVMGLEGFDKHVCEVIVVDSSDDGTTRDVLVGLKIDKLVLHFLDRKTIPATARNIGAKQAHGDILVFVDSDVRLDARWLIAVVGAVESGKRVGSGAIWIDKNQKSQSICVAQLFLQFNEYLPYGSDRDIWVAPACNMFCTRDILSKAGGFPEIRASRGHPVLPEGNGVVLGLVGG